MNEELFFKVSDANFRTDDATWFEFASSLTSGMVRVVELASASYTLTELLGILAHHRKQFALQEQHNQDDCNQFGEWRTGVYAGTIRMTAELHEQHQQTQQAAEGADLPALPTNFGIPRTIHFVQTEKFARTISNLNAESVLPGVRYENRISDREDNLVTQLVAEVATINPQAYLQKVKHQRFTFATQDDQQALTSIYMPGNAVPAYILVEHPPAGLVYQLLTDDAEQKFRQLLAEEQEERYLQKLSDLIWLLYQLMPFVRGSASIVQILTAALLKYRRFPLRRYQEGRHDIDAMSLTANQFQKRFMAGLDPLA